MQMTSRRIPLLTRPRTVAAWALLVALTAPSVGAGPAPRCDDCKFLPCLDQDLARAEQMKNMYRQVGSEAKSANEYKEMVDARSAPILNAHDSALAGLPQCQTKFPDLTNYAEQRRWNALGWGVEFKEGGKMGVSYGAHTDPEKCTLRQSQIDKLKEILPCLEIAEATEVHEKDHVARCEKAKPATAKEMAAYEVKGYEAEIKKLRSAQNYLKNKKKCEARSELSEDADGDQRLAQRERVRRATERVAAYAATI